MSLSRLHISNISLKGARSQLEEQSFLMATLRPQHLLPQLSIIKLALLAASAWPKMTCSQKGFGRKSFFRCCVDIKTNKQRKKKLTVKAVPFVNKTVLSGIRWMGSDEECMYLLSKKIAKKYSAHISLQKMQKNEYTISQKNAPLKSCSSIFCQSSCSAFSPNQGRSIHYLRGRVESRFMLFFSILPGTSLTFTSSL